MFDDRLKKLRDAKGVTQAEAAEALGIGERAYGNYEKDLREPNAVVLKAMSKYYGVTIDYLLDCHTGLAASKQEQEHIKKYRDLDEHGKKMVDFVLNEEYDRRTEQKNEEITHTNIFRAAKSTDNHPPEITTTDKDFSKIPPTDIKL